MSLPARPVARVATAAGAGGLAGGLAGGGVVAGLAGGGGVDRARNRAMPSRAEPRRVVELESQLPRLAAVERESVERAAGLAEQRVTAAAGAYVVVAVHRDVLRLRARARAASKL